MIKYTYRREINIHIDNKSKRTVEQYTYIHIYTHIYYIYAHIYYIYAHI